MAPKMVTALTKLLTQYTDPVSQQLVVNNQWAISGVDAAGNVYLPVTNGYHADLAYDGENRMVGGKTGPSATMSAEYDGEGHRVKRTVNTVTTVYVYDAMGGPTALGKLAKINQEFSITQAVLGGMHDLGLLPATAIPGPQSSAAEVQQANAVARMTGNDMLLVDNPNNQGFDALQIVGGFVNPQGAIPTELTGLTSDNPQAVLTETVATERAANGVTLPSGNNLTGVEMFISAPNMNANAVANFANNGPLPSIVGRSSVQKVTVTTSNGTVTIQNKQVTASCQKTGDNGTCQ
ncbi:MAG: hypothetical protein QM757_38135 [Paludibaculum sp.]